MQTRQTPAVTITSKRKRSIRAISSGHRALITSRSTVGYGYSGIFNNGVKQIPSFGGYGWNNNEAALVFMPGGFEAGGASAGLYADKWLPSLSEPAADFTLPDVVTSKNVSLHDFRGKTPVVLVFGSYTCPNFRSSAEALKALQVKYGAKAQFLLVYIREAHADGDWQSTRN